MSTKSKVAATVLVFTIAGFLLNPETPLGAAVWGPSAELPGEAPPPGWAVPTLIVVALLQALAFGGGFAFLFFGRDAVRRLGATTGLATWTWLAVAWLLLSWVPHGALHQTSGADLGKLAIIEVAFHVTLMAGAAVLGLFLVRAADERGAPAARHPVPMANALAVAPAAVVLKRGGR